MTSKQFDEFKTLLLNTGISEYEALKFIDDANLIYKLHLNFTSEFYHRQVSLLSLERCEELLNEIESIEI